MVFSESIPDQSKECLSLPGDPVSQRHTQAENLHDRLSSPAISPDSAVISEPIQAASPEPVLPDQRPDDAPATRRIMFPAAAPEELLQAAAEAAAAMRAEGLLGEIVSGLSAQNVGPVPPPDVLKELNAVSGDVRMAEAVRVNTLAARAPTHGIHPSCRIQSLTTVACVSCQCCLSDCYCSIVVIDVKRRPVKQLHHWLTRLSFVVIRTWDPAMLC